MLFCVGLVLCWYASVVCRCVVCVDVGCFVVCCVVCVVYVLFVVGLCSVSLFVG